MTSLTGLMWLLAGICRWTLPEVPMSRDKQPGICFCFTSSKSIIELQKNDLVPEQLLMGSLSDKLTVCSTNDNLSVDPQVFYALTARWLVDRMTHSKPIIKLHGTDRPVTAGPVRQGQYG